jgi:serine/threonine protein kinase
VGPRAAATGGLFGPGGSDVVVGTPLYMAPEQARGLNHTVAASDLWSIGIMAIELLTGILPYTLENHQFAADKLMHDLAYDSEFKPNIPAGLDGPALDFITKCLHKDPTRRGTA